MARLCPRCNESFEDRWYCPTCGVRLVADSAGAKSAAQPKESAPKRQPPPSRVMTTLSRLFAFRGAKWQQTTWGRCLIGVLLAQGLFYALFQMAWAIMMIFADRATVGLWWNTLAGLLLKQFLQAISVLAGAILAGAGQRRAVRNGTIVGLYNGFLFLLVDAFVTKPNEMALIAQPLLQTAFGTLGGYLGRVIWKPAAPIMSVRLGRPGASEFAGEGATAPLDTAAMATIPLPSPPRRSTAFAGQVGWIRVAIGTAIVVAGCISAEYLLKEFMRERDGLILTVDTPNQMRFITWEISVLAMIFGGAFAGANTFNGPLQGTIVGMISTTVLVGNILQSGMADGVNPAQTLGLSFLGIQLNTLAMQVIGTVFSVMPLSVVGGWFGGQLLPPVMEARKVSKTYTAPV